MGVLDALIYGIRTILSGGSPQPARPAINFAGNVTVADNPGANRTDVTVTAVSAPTGTGIAHVSSGAFSSPASLIVDADVSDGAAIIGHKISGHGIAKYDTYANTDHTITADQDVIGISSLTAPHTVKLPISPLPTQGREYEVLCFDGTATNTNTLTLDGNGTTINGSSTLVIANTSTPYGCIRVRFNGLAWNIVHQR